jgi:hypothetical protein
MIATIAVSNVARKMPNPNSVSNASYVTIFPPPSYREVANRPPAYVVATIIISLILLMIQQKREHSFAELYLFNLR